MSDMTTVRDGFPVINVTHKPKRMQNSNLKNRIGDDISASTSEVDSEVPSMVTLERAINFYETHAEGDYANLYSQTAKWLREFMSRSIPVSVETTDGGQ